MGQDEKIIAKRIRLEHAMGDKEKQKGKSDGRYDNGDKKGDDRVKEEKRAQREGIIEKGVRVGKERWKIVGVYVEYMKENIDEVLRIIEKWMEEKKEGVNVLIGGDFNARTGREGKEKRGGL
ncbi:hypothetical protein P5V15_001318 [Pogonomyrmex californicus]